ncbi:alpha-mannosidase 2 [Cryptotermes secundus]|nr:alpha-mannosidase 2 [Cryptotermes secundus]XP_023714692.1 alpha-mannosidase 2 [Cryptotermes secundus]XP_023714693.1 alpha-mannosidase 2 [Cryptotermes secundus]XP_023714694.1 alpha-mannosidase 2 [Cryptotermes secundus]
MRVRKMSALVGAALILGGCLVLYMMMDLAVFPSDVHDNKWVQFEGRLKQLEVDLHRHHETVGKLKHTIKHLISNSPIPNQYQQHSNHTVTVSSTTTIVPESHVSCSSQFRTVPRTDIQMLDVYKELKFDNIDGGAWKQGWNVELSEQEWGKRKLRVFVVPHSHNDPGWIKTFEDYYHSQTRNILNNMVSKLSEDPRRKFIWAEISFFSLWWDEIPAETKEQVKKLISDGQLEIVTGGWVMNDEASTHYFSMLLQMMEGHQWLLNQIEFKPRNSWSIDPFGQSPTMAYLLKRMGLENLVIQRVHYSVKKYLARNKNLEFRWRQLWDGDGSSDLFTHMMPFYSYDVPHTCGPDPKICCQFDFRRLPGYGISCPWKVPPQVITKQNVAHRAGLLLEQYRKKAQLYQTNVVLAPLGDDFRYDHASEWDAQYNNYQKIFDFWNSKPHLNVEAQFGTLKDYFNAVREESMPEGFLSLSGDFFTYADRDDHYWSGYYTSRPFYKRVDRMLVSYVRATELLFSLAWGTKQSSSDWLLAPESGLTKLLSDARRSLSLFQHHDAITGTAKDHVVEDYAKKLLEAINGMQHVMQQTAHFLLSPPQVPYQPNSEFVYFDMDNMRKQHYSIPEKAVVFFGEGFESQRVVLYNSLTWRREELVTLRVSTRNVKVTDAAGISVPSQTSPVFQEFSDVIAESHYDITFMADVPSLGLTTYLLHAVLPAKNIDNAMSHVKLLNFVGSAPRIEGFEYIEVVDEAKEFSIHNDHLSAAFSEQGLLKAVTLKDTGVTVPLHLDFARYHARQGQERSGAYLFLPDREAETVKWDSSPVRIVEGPLFSQVHMHLPGVQHTVTLVNTQGTDSLGLEVQNVVDISDQVNCELVMRISSNIKNGDDFYTDLNGLQIIRRKRFFKLPLQANYYPLPTMAFIQDQAFRFTVVTAQPLGVGSLKEGQIEVMQDRRLNQDDNRGLGQGVTDNKPFPATFRLILEQRQPSCQGTASDHPAGLPTVAAHVASLSLLHPLFHLLWLGKTQDKLESRFAPMTREPGSDIHVVMLHTLTSQSGNAAGLVVHRQEMDPCFPLEQFSLSNGLLNVSNLLPTQFGNTMKEATLSFLDEGKTVQKNAAHPICHMEMSSFIFTR